MPMERDRYPYPGHQYLCGELKPCPFCGEMPYIESCDRIIVIGCEPCHYHMQFHGLVQSDFETKVIVSKYKDTGEAYEWYDKDAYETAVGRWNMRIGGNIDADGQETVSIRLGEDSV